MRARAIFLPSPLPSLPPLPFLPLPVPYPYLPTPPLVPPPPPPPHLQADGDSVSAPQAELQALSPSAPRAPRKGVDVTIQLLTDSSSEGPMSFSKPVGDAEEDSSLGSILGLTDNVCCTPPLSRAAECYRIFLECCSARRSQTFTFTKGFSGVSPDPFLFLSAPAFGSARFSRPPVGSFQKASSYFRKPNCYGGPLVHWQFFGDSFAETSAGGNIPVQPRVVLVFTAGNWFEAPASPCPVCPSL